jgi:hypothetical protein
MRAKNANKYSSQAVKYQPGMISNPNSSKANAEKNLKSHHFKNKQKNILNKNTEIEVREFAEQVLFHVAIDEKKEKNSQRQADKLQRGRPAGNIKAKDGNWSCVVTMALLV